MTAASATAAAGCQAKTVCVRLVATLFRVFGAQRPLCALDGEALVAVAGIAPAGTCQATLLQRLRFLPSMIAIGPGAASRVSAWLAAWGERDPDQSHSHLGPVAVEPQLQGRGIGSQLMREHCRRGHGRRGRLPGDR
jgi:ribosomal protein S18 acetylase RimI-like enzyme